MIGGGGDKAATRSGAQSASPASSTADWATAANKICAPANDAISALPDPKTLNLDSGARIGRQAFRISAQMFRDLAALLKPPQRQDQIDRLLRLGTRVNELGATMFDDLRIKNFPGAIRAQQSLSHLGQKLDNAAIALGATTCSEGSSSVSVALPGG